MKKIIAAALSILVGAFGYTIVDEAMENRVSTLESKVACLESIVSEKSATETTGNIIDSGTCGEQATWILYLDGTMIISGVGETNSFTVPWQGFVSQIKKIVIDYGITSVGAGMFSGSSNLTEVSIPDSVTAIGFNAFSNCTNLTFISIPDSVETIGYCAFAGCENLSSIKLSNSIKSISGGEIFAGCEKLNNLVIPEGVISIYGYNFMGCNSLTTITLPKSLTLIGDDAFYDCNNITDIFYNGTEEQWNLVSINMGNDSIKNATIHYNNQ